MTICYFAFGPTLAALVNFETLIDTPQVLNEGRIPSVRPVKERSLDGFLTRAGKITSKLIIDVPTDAARIAFNAAAFGGQTVASAEQYISSLGDDGHYNPYLVVIERPVEQEDYQLIPGGRRVKALTINLFNPRLQSVTKNANATLTASERLVYVDTSGGNRTMTLPAASAVQANTVLSIVKAHASNTLSIQRGGTDTLDGGTSAITQTANGARVDLISNGSNAWVTI